MKDTFTVLKKFAARFCTGLVIKYFLYRHNLPILKIIKFIILLLFSFYVHLSLTFNNFYLLYKTQFYFLSVFSGHDMSSSSSYMKRKSQTIWYKQKKCIKQCGYKFSRNILIQLIGKKGFKFDWFYTLCTI